MSNTIHIAIDAMGGDFGPRLCVPAAQKFLSEHADVTITLVGDEALILPLIRQDMPRLNLVHTPLAVDMSDKPSAALRHKTQSSMAVAIGLVADGNAHACVSAGNTGALMAFGLRELMPIEGVARPAICKALPSEKGVCWVLDLGASLDCSAQQLLQFAQMGKALAQKFNVAQPRIGLLNVGAEASKGRDIQREAAQLFSETFAKSEYVGFVEGGDIFRGKVDVAVCDGFTGNVMLKASEGATDFLQKSLQQMFTRSLTNRLIGLLARPIMRRWRKEYDLARFNGAVFLGLSKVLVKSHGSASEKGFLSAINVAFDQVNQQVVEEIQRGLKFNNNKV